MPEPLVLASASQARAALLRVAGAEFDVEPADIDETQLKQAYQAAGKPASECALALAREKASFVAARRPGSLVIGADQILVLGREWLDKPADLQAARTQLRALRGQTHRLATAVCVVAEERPIWHAVSEPELTMRRFGEAFLDAYVAAEGKSLLGSVGCYRLEASGIQLFSRIAGDYFAILGLPLLELLGFLRDYGILRE